MSRSVFSVTAVVGVLLLFGFIAFLFLVGFGDSSRSSLESQLKKEQQLWQQIHRLEAEAEEADSAGDAALAALKRQEARDVYKIIDAGIDRTNGHIRR